MLIYFEEVLSGGRTLKLISDYIKHLKREQDSSSEPRSSFELVITLIDRTSMHTKNEILRKLPIDNNKFISFTRLNVPIISAAQVGDPLKKRIESLKKMMHHTLWDSLKVTIGNEVSKKTPKVLEDVLNKSLEVTTPPYFPFKNEGIIDEKTYETYKRKYNQEHLDLLKLFLADYINNNIKKHSNNSDNIKGLIDGTYEAIQATVANFFVDTQNTNNSRDEGTEKQIVRDLIFKILCRPPFIYYHDIYEAVFQYCIEKLENIRRNWESKEKISFEEFRQLKFFIRRSVELNSNFILSKKFITCIRDHYQKIAIIGEEDQPELNDGEMIYEHVKYKKKQIESFPYFLMYSYKLLISRSPTKSIHLESIINSHDLLPRQITEPENTDQELKELLRDTYYCLLGMIKAENIYLLSDLKDYHKGKKNRFNNVDEIREYYFHTATNVPQIINAQKLIGNSRYGLDNTQEVEKNKGIRQIQLAVSHMLNTVSVLKTNNSTKPNSNSIDFDDNIRAILDSLIKILQPDDDNKSQLHYALCIEYKKQSQDRNPNEYIYTVSSNYSVSQDADEIRLSEDGIINNLLRGLYDTPDCSHVQTFLTAVRLGDEVVSFASNYYRSGYANPISFKEAYNKDRDANFHTLKNAKMTLFIRLADLIEENDKKGNPLFNLEGQAVLVIASSEPAKTSSFIRLMSNENLRLLLLLKTDLLEYLYKQFENDAFIEVLESRKRENSNKKLRHGIIRYIRDQSSIYNTICEEIIQYTKDNLITSNDQLDNYDEHTRSRRENYMLPLNIIDDAIRTQFSFRQQIDKLKKGVELPEEYEQEKVRERIECILKYPCFGGWSADPNDENIADKIEIRGFNEQKKIVLHPSIFKVVIPELYSRQNQK